MSATLPRGVGEAVGRRLTPEPERPLPRDPVKWVRDELDQAVWSVPKLIFRSVVKNRKTAVQSCHGIGKSWGAGVLAAWWIEGHPPGEAMVVTTAPSGHQVRTILWGEINRAHRRGRLPGRITRGQVPEWVIDGDQVAFGRKPADYVDAEQARTQFQGIHARYLLVILDEACGVPTWLWEAVETLVTNEASRILAIGNPDDPATQFEKICRPGSGWNVIQVGAEDTPAFTGEQIPEQLRESLVSKLWVEERRREWGEQSPLYISKVLGLFPETADDVVITPGMIRKGHELDLSGWAITDPGRGGMDVARLGKDETAIYWNRGGVIRLEASWHKLDTDASRVRAEAILEEHPNRQMTIDVVGLGAGVYDPLRAKGFPVLPFSGGEKANDERRFVNKNAEAWWAFRDGLDAGLIDLDPDDLTLASQLQSRKWRVDASQKRIRLETKDEMATRGIPSPDRADAAVMCWYEGVSVPDAAVVLPGEGEQATITGDLLDMPT